MLRKSMTAGEHRLWSELKEWRKLYGTHWRRQAPLGPYIADFVCHGLKLVVEVDGEFHHTQEGSARDARRDAWMNSQGYRVFRINTGELSEHLDGCVETLLREAELA